MAPRIFDVVAVVVVVVVIVVTSKWNGNERLWIDNGQWNGTRNRM